MTYFPPDDESPCTKVCVLDSTRVCIGCGRDIDEIAGWSAMNAAQRSEANLRAKARLAARTRDNELR